METEFAAKELSSDLPGLHTNYNISMDLVHVVCGSKLFIEVFYLYGEKNGGNTSGTKQLKKCYPLFLLCFHLLWNKLEIMFSAGVSGCCQ